MIATIRGDARTLNGMCGATGLQNPDVSEAERVDALILYADMVGDERPLMMKHLDPLFRHHRLS